MSRRRKSLKLLKINVGVNMLSGTKLTGKQQDLPSSAMSIIPMTSNMAEADLGPLKRPVS